MLNGMRNGVLGLVLAGAGAVSLSDFQPFGIDAWKIVLAAAGAILFVLNSDRRRGERGEEGKTGE